MKIKTSFILISCLILIIGCNQQSPAQIQLEKKIRELAVQNKLSEFQIEHGIGPFKQAVLVSANTDEDMVIKGKALFRQRCIFCHKVDSVMYAPSLRYVADRRSPTFILNILLNPEEMTEKHPLAKQLSILANNKMRFQNLEEADARSVLDYLRELNQEGIQKKITTADTVLNLIDL